MSVRRRCSRKSAPHPANAVPNARRNAGWPVAYRRFLDGGLAIGVRRLLKAAICSGVGGRPVRSKYKRRSKVRSSASGPGRCPASSAASTWRSMPLCGQVLSLLRRSRFGHRLKGPEPAGGLEIELLILRRDFGTLTRIRRAHGNPFFEISHLLGGQAFLGRHLQLRVGITDRLDQKALAHLPGMIAAPLSPPSCQPPFQSSRSHPSPSHPCCGTGNTHSPTRAGFFLKKLQPRRIGRPSGGCRQKNKCHKTLHVQKVWQPRQKMRGGFWRKLSGSVTAGSLYFSSRARRLRNLTVPPLPWCWMPNRPLSDCLCSTSAISLPLRKVRMRGPWLPRGNGSRFRA